MDIKTYTPSSLAEEVLDSIMELQATLEHFHYVADNMPEWMEYKASINELVEQGELPF